MPAQPAIGSRIACKAASVVCTLGLQPWHLRCLQRTWPTILAVRLREPTAHRPCIHMGIGTPPHTHTHTHTYTYSLTHSHSRSLTRVCLPACRRRNAPASRPCSPPCGQSTAAACSTWSWRSWQTCKAMVFGNCVLCLQVCLCVCM